MAATLAKRRKFPSGKNTSCSRFSKCIICAKDVPTHNLTWHVNTCIDSPSRETLQTVDESEKKRDSSQYGPLFDFLDERELRQARLSSKESPLKLIKNSPTNAPASATVLQPGMVLMRNALGLDIQQNFVEAAQTLAEQFHRPCTAGGGKYHVYSACFGSFWDAKKLEYVKSPGMNPLPKWIFDLTQNLVQAAEQQSPVLAPRSAIFEPDVGLVNYYPVRDSEIGEIGIGGHQDLDNTIAMPVVSVSVGDSMTFFYRRLPPLHRRKTGVMVRVDLEDEKDSLDGDASHNQEHCVVLNSGDVLIFGGKSRLVYHGTKNIRPGTKPASLRMTGGRLNFTFRQKD